MTSSYEISQLVANQANTIDYNQLDQAKKTTTESIIKNNLSLLGSKPPGTSDPIRGFQTLTHEGQDNMGQGLSLFGRTDPDLNIPGLLPESGSQIQALDNASYDINTPGSPEAKCKE